MNLEELRKQLDQIDIDLLNILATRMKISKDIGDYKKANNIPPLDKARWNEVVESRIETAKKLNLNEQGVKDILEAIHKMSLNQQN